MRTPALAGSLSVLRVRHVVVTLFNCRLDATTFPRALDDAWLRHRWQLFETITVPSLAGQCSTDFEWVIWLHSQSPPWLKKRAAELSDLPFRAWVLLGQDPGPGTMGASDRERLTDPSLDALLTTRIDSDDAFAHCAMARVRQSFEADPWSHQVLNFDVGYQLDHAGRRLTVVRFRSPPFSTLIKRPPITSPLSFGGIHTQLPLRYAYRVINQGDPMYLQTIHGANVSNRLLRDASLLTPELSEHILREAFNIDVARFDDPPPPNRSRGRGSRPRLAESPPDPTR